MTRRDALQCLLHGQRRRDRQQSQSFDGPSSGLDAVRVGDLRPEDLKPAADADNLRLSVMGQVCDPFCEPVFREIIQVTDNILASRQDDGVGLPMSREDRTTRRCTSGSMRSESKSVKFDIWGRSISAISTASPAGRAFSFGPFLKVTESSSGSPRSCKIGDDAESRTPCVALHITYGIIKE